MVFEIFYGNKCGHEAFKINIYKTKYGVCWCMVIKEKGQLRFKVTYWQ